MDFEEDFRQACREAAAACVRRNKSTSSFKGTNGQPLVGWTVESQDWNRDRGNPGGRGAWFEEGWGKTTTFLAEDGELYVHEFSGYEGTDYPNGAQLSDSVRGPVTSSMVGTKGKPFAEWKSRIERLPYT